MCSGGSSSDFHAYVACTLPKHVQEITFSTFFNWLTRLRDIKICLMQSLSSFSMTECVIVQFPRSGHEHTSWEGKYTHLCGTPHGTPTIVPERAGHSGFLWSVTLTLEAGAGDHKSVISLMQCISLCVSIQFSWCAGEVALGLNPCSIVWGLWGL